MQVHAGDLVIADGSGVVVIPRSQEEEVVKEAEAVAATEARMADGSADGRLRNEQNLPRGHEGLHGFVDNR